MIYITSEDLTGTPTLTYAYRMRTNDAINRAVYAHLSSEGRTQTELASLIGIPQSSLSQRLHGVRTWHTREIDALVALGVLEPVHPPQNEAPLSGQCSCSGDHADRPSPGLVEERIVSADRWTAVVRNATLAAWNAWRRTSAATDLGLYAPVLVEEMLSNDVLNLVDKGYNLDDVRRIIDTARYTANESLRAEEFPEICGKSLDALLEHIDDEVEQ